MGKESKETLRQILMNTELIMKHLKIATPINKISKTDAKPAVKSKDIKRQPAKIGAIKKK